MFGVHGVPTEQRRRAEFESGDYFCTDRDLFRVEEVVGDHVLVENCRDGELVDVPCSDLRRLRRVEREAALPPEGGDAEQSGAPAY